jgi:putative NADH-flavin reductase
MVSHIGVLDSPEGGLRGEGFSDEFKPIFLGHRAAFEALRKSHVDWTLVCPPNLPDGPPTGDFEYEIEGLPTGVGNKAFTGDVAHLMIQVLDEPSTFQKRLGIVSRQPG